MSFHQNIFVKIFYGFHLVLLSSYLSAHDSKLKNGLPFGPKKLKQFTSSNRCINGPKLFDISGYY